MFPARVYVGQIIAVFAIVLAALWGATQWAASALGYQAALGPAWFTIAGYPVYLPWRLFEWWYVYDAYAPHVFEQAGAIAAFGGVAGALFAVVNSVWRARQNTLVTTYGSARWARVKEIAAAGLFKPKGVFLGRMGDAYLRLDGPEHVMCFAPTRSGKGVGLVLPTLLSWTSSAVVHDIKGENWQTDGGMAVAVLPLPPVRSDQFELLDDSSSSKPNRPDPTCWLAESGSTPPRSPMTRLRGFA